jgi:hypothetical protein
MSRAVRHPLGPPAPPRRHFRVIIQGGYMTGDQFGISGALTLDASLVVLVLKQTTHPKDQTGLMLKLYESATGGAAGRVGSLTVVDAVTMYKKLTKSPVKFRAEDVSDVDIRNALNALNIEKGDVQFLTVGIATSILGDQAGDRYARSDIEATWVDPRLNDEELQMFLQGRRIYTNGKYLFLWIRMSGRTGGAHAELDTGREALSKVLPELESQTGRTAVLVGDAFDKAGRFATTIDMIEYWKKFAPFTRYKDIPGRKAQLSLYNYMFRAKYDVVHLGMRSGVLESVALLGMAVIYLEERDNPQRDRMLKLVGGIANYKQLELEKPPTRTGQVLVQRQKLFLDRVKPAINEVAKVSSEKLAVIMDRYQGLEAATPTGVFNTRQDMITAYVNIAMPAWRAGGFVRPTETYTQYRGRHPRWCENLEAKLGELYRAAFSKEGLVGEITREDLRKIIVAIKSAVPLAPDATRQGLYNRLYRESESAWARAVEARPELAEIYALE